MAGNDARLAGLITFFMLIAVAVMPGDVSGAPLKSATPREFADKIAARYGASDFSRVESIQYTFNVRFGGKTVTRHWTWFPKLDSVGFRGPDPKGVMLTAGYSRRNPFSMAAPQIAGIDRSFVNDQYWLLFPLHLKWDSGLDLSLGSVGDRLDDLKPAGEPANAEPAAPVRRTLRVRYPAAGGYTPGDAYDLIAEEDGTVHSWIFHKNGADTATMHAHWSAPVSVNGLPISLNRPGSDGFKVWFTDVKVSGLASSGLR